MPFFSRENCVFGGNTTCVRIDCDGNTLLLDCGTGLLQYLLDEKDTIAAGLPLNLDILIGHLHMDHIIGLSSFSPLFDGKNDIRFYTKSRGTEPLEKQVLGLFSPPYWPIDLSEMNKASFIEIGKEAFVTKGGFRVQAFNSGHKDGTTAFKLTGDKTIVYLLDCEIEDTETNKEEIIEYCKDADVVLFDGSYLPEEYPGKKGWGHSTYEQGIRLAEQAGCKQMVFSHFSQNYTDETLNTVKAKLAKTGTQYHLGYDGMELDI